MDALWKKYGLRADQQRELPSFPYRGSHIVAKLDLIDYLVATANDANGKHFRIGEKKHGK